MWFADERVAESQQTKSMHCIWSVAALPESHSFRLFHWIESPARRMTLINRLKMRYQLAQWNRELFLYPKQSVKPKQTHRK